MEYILAVPAARYGDFADDLQKLHKGQDATQEWCAQTIWGDSRLVVAHDPVAANKRTTPRDNKVAELVKLGRQCCVKLDEQDESQRTGKKNTSKCRPMSDSGTKARFYHAVKDAYMVHLIKVDLKSELFSYTKLDGVTLVFCIRYCEVSQSGFILRSSRGAQRNRGFLYGAIFLQDHRAATYGGLKWTPEMRQWFKLDTD